MMMSSRLRRATLTASLGMVMLAAIAATAQAHSNIVRTAQKAGSFNTLIAAAKAAGLAGVLANRHGLTVFEPTDAAFAKLPKGTVENLLKPRNRGKLRQILLYHVVGRRLPASKIPHGRTHVWTLAGKAVAVRKRRGVRVNRAHVVKADVRASNGVIHVINRVLIP